MRVLLTILLMVTVSGCATARKSADINSVQSRMVALEQELDGKDSEIEKLRDEVDSLSSELKDRQTDQLRSAIHSTTTTNYTTNSSREGIIRVNVSAEQVQTALAGAGYYSGPIDGKIGRKTKQAIAEFQRGHRLKADGIVGQKTWVELEAYLN